MTSDNQTLKKTEISEIEQILLEEKQIFEVKHENDKYAIPHDFDFNEYFRKTFSCLYEVYDKSRFIPVEKQVVRDLIAEATLKGGSNRNARVWISVGAAGANCLDSYTNHLSDYDCYYFDGQGAISLRKDDRGKWRLSAKINSGELHSA